MNDSPWIGYFSGYKGRGFEFGVNDEGQGKLFLIDKKKKARAGKKTIHIFPELLVENEQGNIAVKRFKDKEGFASEMKAGLDHREVKFTAETRGDAKVEIHIKYDRDRIIFDGNVLDRGSLKKGKLYLCFRVIPSEMYSGRAYSSKDEKELRKVMKKDRIKFVRAEDNKRVSVTTYEEVDLGEDEMAKGGVTLVSADLSSQESKKFIYTTLDGRDVLELENRDGKKGYLWKGYVIRWKKLYEDADAAEGADSKTGRRNSRKKTQSPFVLQVR